MPEADELAEMIAKSERPLILSGHGVQIAGATDLLLQVAERAEIPVAHTLLGIGNIDETHRLRAATPACTDGCTPTRRSSSATC